MAIMQEIETKLQKGISVSTDEEVYYALLELVKDKAEKKVSNKGKKKLYYISAEFLIGKLLSNNLINLGIYDEVKETLEKNGKSLAEIEEIELEPSLGAGCGSWKWWSWTSCSMLHRFNRNTRAQRRRCRPQLPLRIIQAGI